MDKLALRKRRQGRIRSQISGTAVRPRLSIFKSNKYFYAQLIDDTTGNTLASVDSRKAKAKTPVEKVVEIGKELAQKALGVNVKEVVFDRGGFKYTGSVKSFADAVREGGLKF